MTGLVKNLKMNYRGLIQGVLDFPELSDRKDGNAWVLAFPSAIGDVKMGTVVSVTNGTGYVNATHQNPIAANYCKINGTSTIFINELVVGDVLLIDDTEIRAITVIESDTVLYLDLALEMAVSGVSFKKKLADGTWSDDLDGTIATDVNHFVYDNPYYKHVYSADAAFALLIAGDKISITIDTVVQERIIQEIINSGEIIITEPYYGDISSIDSAPEAVAVTKTFAAFPIENIGASNLIKILFWTETSADGYGWICFSQENIDGTSKDLIPAGVPVNAVATVTVLTFAGQPTSGKIVTFGDDVYEWYPNGGSPDPYSGNIGVEIGVTTDASITNFETIFNGNTSYHVNAVKDLVLDKITFTATSLFEYYNDLPTTEDDGNLSFPDITFGGGTGSSTPGVNATPSHKGERLLDVAGSKVWVAKDDNTDIYSLTTHWISMTLS